MAFRDTGWDFNRDDPSPPEEVVTVSHQLTIHGDRRDGLVAVAVLELRHSNRRANAYSRIVSLRHFTRAEWDADPAGCIADEITLLIAPSVGVG